MCYSFVCHYPGVYILPLFDLDNNPHIHADQPRRQLYTDGTLTGDLLLSRFALENSFFLVGVPISLDRWYYPRSHRDQLLSQESSLLSCWIVEHLSGWWLYHLHHIEDIWLFYFQDSRDALLFKLAKGS
jgi:hypothetical protein